MSAARAARRISSRSWVRAFSKTSTCALAVTRRAYKRRLSLGSFDAYAGDRPPCPLPPRRRGLHRPPVPAARGDAVGPAAEAGAPAVPVAPAADRHLRVAGRL